MTDLLATEFTRLRPELHAYLCRLVIRPQLAEDLAQTTYLRSHEAVDRLPDTAGGRRAWLFKTATHLAFDELRRHSTWREFALDDLRTAAMADQAFTERSRAMSGTPETRAIAREHVVACIACTLRNLPERKAAALLLKEMHGFSIEETAGLLEASPVQVKNWLQEARAHMDARYGRTCALRTKEGVCHQCRELDAFLADGDADPLPDDTGVDARLRVAQAFRERPWGAWHRIMFDLLDDLA